MTVESESQIDKWFKSMHEYKEQMRKRYLETVQSESRIG